MSSRSLPGRNAVALTLAAASWGLGTVISKRAVDEIPPLTLLPIQLGSSLVVLVAVMRARGLAIRKAGVSPVLGRLGLLNPGLAYALSLLGLVSITASLSVLLWALEPILILGLAGWFLRERITVAVIGISAAAVGGVALLVIGPASSGEWTGIGLTVAGIACCAAYTVIARRWLGTANSTLAVVAVQEAYALAFALVVLSAATVFNGGFRMPSISTLGWLSAIGSGVLYYAAAYWFYLTGLRAAPASFAAAAFYLIPVFGVAGGAILLGERLDASQWVGAAIVIGAVIMLAWRQSAGGACLPAPAG